MVIRGTDSIFTGGAFGPANSYDGGVTWNEYNQSNLLSNSRFLNSTSSILFLSGQRGRLYVSYDYGNSYTQKTTIWNSSDANYVNGMDNNNDTFFVASTLIKYTYKTTDTFTTLNVVDTTSQAIDDILILNDSIVICVGRGGVIARSTDYGNAGTFTEQAVGTGDYTKVRCVDSVCWAVGSGNLLSKSTDYGATWTLIDAGFKSDDLYAIEFKDQDVGYVGGDLCKYSSDGGKNWRGIEFPSGEFIYDIRCVGNLCYFSGKGNMYILDTLTNRLVNSDSTTAGDFQPTDAETADRWRLYNQNYNSHITYTQAQIDTLEGRFQEAYTLNTFGYRGGGKKTYNSNFLIYATMQDSISDQGYEFDGISDNINCRNDNSVNEYTAIAISCWIKLDSCSVNSPYGGIVTKGIFPSLPVNSSFTLNYRCNISPNKLSFWKRDSNDLGFGSVQTNFTDTSAWHHVVAIYDGANLKLYLDNSLKTSTPDTDGILTNTSDLLIGKDGTFGTFNGNIDEVRLYSRTLTDDEIGFLYRKENEPNAGLMAYYDFEDSIIRDMSDNSNWGDRGNFTYLGFDGLNDYCITQDTVFDPSKTNFTASLWFNTDDVTGGTMITQQDGTGLGRNWLRFRNSKLASNLGSAGGVDGSNVLETNKWYHGAVSYDGDSLRLWLNGRQDTAVARTIDSATGFMVFGSNKGLVSEFYDGELDNMQIFNLALTASQIRLLYGEGHETNTGYTTITPVVWWRLDETSGDTAFDSEGSNNALLVNSPTWGSEATRGQFTTGVGGNAKITMGGCDGCRFNLEGDIQFDTAITSHAYTGNGNITVTDTSFFQNVNKMQWTWDGLVGDWPRTDFVSVTNFSLNNSQIDNIPLFNKFNSELTILDVRAKRYTGTFDTDFSNYPDMEFLGVPDSCTGELLSITDNVVLVQLEARGRLDSVVNSTISTAISVYDIFGNNMDSVAMAPIADSLLAACQAGASNIYVDFRNNATPVSVATAIILADSLPLYGCQTYFDE